MKITYENLLFLVELFKEDYPEGIDEKELQELFIYFYDDILDNLRIH